MSQIRLRIHCAAILACLVPMALAAAPFPAEIDLADLDPANGGDGSIGVLLEAQATGDSGKGSSVSTGDIDGDGVPDLVVGAPGYARGACRTCAAYVAFGRSDFGASFDLLEDLNNGADGVVLETIFADQGGTSVNAAGDVNGDGFDDVVVSAPDTTPRGLSQAGRVYVLFGRATGFPGAFFDGRLLLPRNGGDGSAGFVLNGFVEGDRTGQIVSGGCDYNADGVDDLVLGTLNQLGSQLGTVFVVFGRSDGFPALFDLSDLLPANGGNGSEGIVIEGITADEQLTDAVACAPDTNGDAIDDLLLSASGSDERPRSVYILFGHPPPFPAMPDLAELLPVNGGDGSQGRILTGEGTTIASSLAAADVNADGFSDILIGARNDNAPNGPEAGRVYVVFGGSEFPVEFEVTDLLLANGGDGSEGFALNGTFRYDNAGDSVSSVGDVNDDGIDDLALGVPEALWRTSRAFVYFGRVTGFPAEVELRELLVTGGGDGTQGFVLNGEIRGDGTGASLAAAGDVDGDLVDDLLIGQAFGQDGGRAYLVYGRPAVLRGDDIPVPQKD